MVKTTRYCDICGREIHKNFDKFFQIILPEMNEHEEIIPSNIEKDVCQTCFRELYWKIREIKHPKVPI